MDLQELEKTSPFALGKENTGYAQYFDGKSYLNILPSSRWSQRW